MLDNSFPGFDSIPSFHVAATRNTVDQQPASPWHFGSEAFDYSFANDPAPRAASSTCEPAMPLIAGGSYNSSPQLSPDPEQIGGGADNNGSRLLPFIPAFLSGEHSETSPTAIFPHADRPTEHRAPADVLPRNLHTTRAPRTQSGRSRTGAVSLQMQYVPGTVH